MSGTWWTSTSTVYDERTTYPVHAGTVAVDKLKGMNVTIVTTARSDDEARKLLKHLGMPFRA